MWTKYAIDELASIDVTTAKLLSYPSVGVLLLYCTSPFVLYFCFYFLPNFYFETEDINYETLGSSIW